MNEDTRRLDRWLWYARFFKSRTLASRFSATGKLRVNSTPVTKAHCALRVGDVLTFPKGPHIRVIKVVELGTRRGPAVEARTLYEDLEPPPPRAARQSPGALAPVGRDPGSGRPTKAERRATDKLKEGG